MVGGGVAPASGESPIASCCVIGRRHPQQQPFCTFVLIDIAPQLLGLSCCAQTFGSLAGTLANTLTLTLTLALRTQRVQ